jgi:23S rRNA (cytidine1920-2'-O)/16S rRNA (cytidine1409-2'-O)-methyltransferase
MEKSRGKRRIDLILVELGLAESRQKAQALLIAGQVLVDEQKVDKPGRLVSPEARIRLLKRLPFVSRAGTKLAAALDLFDINVAGRVCADLGSSTGGFTDCLLQRGARQVHAYDVGRGQLDWKLRSDKRVVVHDDFNVRYIKAEDLPENISFVSVDLSFISLTKILLPLRAALTAKLLSHNELSCEVPVDLVLLVKPQFEAGKSQVGKGGIVRDAAIRLAALSSVKEHAFASRYEVAGSITSPLPGAKGNEEFLLYLRLFSDLSS